MPQRPKILWYELNYEITLQGLSNKVHIVLREEVEEVYGNIYLIQTCHLYIQQTYIKHKH